MKIIFYQANFCAECGNAMKPRFSLGPRYFCDECEAHMGRRNYFKSVAGLLLCADPGGLRVEQNVHVQSERAGAERATERRRFDSGGVGARYCDGANPEPKPEAVERVICGARTKKGTPCRHLVLPGQRCAQHRGMASLLETKKGRPRLGSKD